MASLFTSQVPSSADNSDGSPGITCGISLRFATSGTVTGIRFYATTTVSGTYTGAAWTVNSADDGFGGTGTLIDSKVRPTAPTPGAWNDINFDTPVAVTAGVLYRFGVHSSAGRYVVTSGFFTSDLVNGDITADADGDNPTGLGILWQGAFNINAALTYPNTAFGGKSNYFIDVNFTPAGGGPTPVSSSLDLQWAVRNTVSSAVDLRWAVRSLVSNTLDARWAVRNTVSAPLDARWAIRAVVSSALDARWAVRTAVSASLDLRWAQRELVSAPLDLRWVQAGRVSSSIDLQWSVREVVSATLDARWAVRSQISRTLDLRWAVRGLVESPVTLLWQVEGAPLPTERVVSDVTASLTGRVRATPVSATVRAILGPR